MSHEKKPVETVDIGGAKIQIRKLSDTNALIELIGKMSEGVQLDAQQKAMGVGQVIGMLSVKVGLAHSRPWQYLCALLVFAWLFTIGLWMWDHQNLFFAWFFAMLGG